MLTKHKTRDRYPPVANTMSPLRLATEYIIHADRPGDGAVVIHPELFYLGASTNGQNHPREERRCQVNHQGLRVYI